jgi:magnesium transporter
MSDSRYFHVARTGELTRVASIEAAMQGGGFAWLDFCQPTRQDLSALVEPLGLHPLAIEDCLDENQIPKVEDYPRQTFMLFNSFGYAGGILSVHEVDAFIGAGFLVTVSGRDAQGQPVLKDIERVVELDMESARQGPAFLLHVVLDRIVDQKFVAVEAIEDDLNTAEESILSDLAHFNPAALLHLRRALLALRKGLFHEREILVKICRKDCPFIGEQAIYAYRDIYDHLAKFFELTEASRDVVTSLMEMYLSMLNNQMAKAANETNATVRRLTFITTIFMPLTLLSGIGGMSEWSMMTGPENWRVAYPLFLLGMTIIGIAAYFLLKWIERRGRPNGRSDM